MDKVPAPLAAPSTDKKQPPRTAMPAVDVTPSPSPVTTSVVTVDTFSIVSSTTAVVHSSMNEKKPSSSFSDGMLVVCLYALLNACVFAVSSIITIIKNQTPCDPKQSTWFYWCVDLTDAAAAEASALVHAQLWCSAPQAAAAALALLLTCLRHRWAWALAFAALAATAANHCMDARVDHIFLAAGGTPRVVVVDVVLDFVVAALDLLGFLCLIFIGCVEE